VRDAGGEAHRGSTNVARRWGNRSLPKERYTLAVLRAIDRSSRWDVSGHWNRRWKPSDKVCVTWLSEAVKDASLGL
jgi:hypothetical protein